MYISISMVCLCGGILLAAGCGGDGPTAPVGPGPPDQTKTPTLARVTGARLSQADSLYHALELVSHRFVRSRSKGGSSWNYNLIEGIVKNVSDSALRNPFVYGKVTAANGFLLGTEQAMLGGDVGGTYYLPKNEQAVFTLDFEDRLNIHRYYLEFYHENEGISKLPLAPALGDRTVSVRGSTVSVTNTSGGSTLVEYRNLVIHVDLALESGSDTERYLEEEPETYIQIWCDGRPEILAGNAARFLKLGINHIATFTSTINRGDCVAGVYFTDEAKAKGWRTTINGIGVVLGDVATILPFTHTITFHPVVLDKSQIASERVWLETMIELHGIDGYDEDLVAQIRRSMPLRLNYEIGEAVVVDTTASSGRIDGEIDIASIAVDSLYNRQINNMLDSDFHMGIVSPNIHQGQRAGWGWTGGSVVSAVNWNTAMRRSMVIEHEIGHNLGLNHVKCSSVGDTVPPPFDENYPIDGGWIDTDGYRSRYGYPLGTLSLAPVVLAADEHFDFMSYCRPAWVSAYNYQKMIDALVERSATPVVARRVIGEPKITSCYFE